jgi:transcriptional regulator with XRE-family HTH domain
MARRFEELRRKMPPARQSKARARTDTMVAELALGELRRNFGVTQEQLAGLLDIRQAAISKIERRDDVLLSTLSAYVRALGGELEIMARFGDHELRLKAASAPRRSLKLKSKRVPRAT